MSLRLTQELDLVTVLTVIVERSMELTGARYGAAATVGPEGVEQFIHRGLTPQQVSALPHLPLGRGLLGEVMHSRRAVRVEHISQHPTSVGFPDAHVPMEAFLGVPMLQRNQLVGALYLTTPPEAPHVTEEDEEICLAMASMAAVGIMNAHLFATESERAERAATLRAIAARVRHSLDVSEVLEATVEALGRAAGADRCFIRMVGAPGSHELGAVQHEWTAPGVPGTKEKGGPVVQSVSSLAARTLRTQWSPNVEADPRLPDPVLVDLRESETAAALSTPLAWGDELLGVVTFHSTTVREWTQSDISLLEAAALEVTAALNHAGLYADAVGTADRLRELDGLRKDFMSMVSHELRSPMTVVSGIAHLLQWRKDQMSTDEIDSMFETLERESRRLTRLVSEFLDMEAIERGQIDLVVEPVDLLDLSAEAMIDSGYARRIELEMEPGDTLVPADRDRIKQVLLNLIGNAAKFSGTEAPITVRVVPQDESVAVSVRDRGPGIAVEDQSLLFQRFSRLAPTMTRAHGSGIGLFVSKQIVELHGGRIWVKSAAGAGAIFFFELPRTRPEH